MQHDEQGNPLAGADAAAAAAFDTGTHAFALFRDDPVGAFDGAIAAAPACAMAHLGKAWLYALATEPAASRAARGFLADAAPHIRDDRATAHAGALAQVLAGDWHAGGVTLERWQAEAPRDLLALQAGHMIDFFRADARSMRDRVARVLPEWRDVPGEGCVLGMGAFGYEEAGDYARAEDLGRAALATDPRDGWAHHAVAHVMEMQGRHDDGLAWMADREAYWSDPANFLKGHNWWHRALCHIEAGDDAGALALYDAAMRPRDTATAVALCDASALLWRLDLSGTDVGDRWARLSTLWDGLADGSYAFNDLHAAMAHLGAGRADAALRLRDGAGGAGEAALWMTRYGTPLIDGFTAFRRGDYAAAIPPLMSARHITGAFGGSHAQRDVIDWTLTECAIRGAMPGLAARLAQERSALRPLSAVNLRFAARAAALAG